MPGDWEHYNEHTQHSYRRAHKVRVCVCAARRGHNDYDDDWMMCSALFTLSLTLHPNLNKSQWNTPEVLLHPFSPCRQHDPASKQLTATRYIYIYIIFVSFEYIGYSSMQHWQNSTNINCSFLVGYLFFYFFPSSSTNNRIICILHAYTIFILAAFERTLLILHFFFFFIFLLYLHFCVVHFNICSNAWKIEQM